MTRRGPWTDQDLLPAAREECLEALRRASEVVGEGVIRMVGGDRQKVWEICGENFTTSRRDAKTAPSDVNRKHLGNGSRR